MKKLERQSWTFVNAALSDSIVLYQLIFLTLCPKQLIKMENCTQENVFLKVAFLDRVHL